MPDDARNDEELIADMARGNAAALATLVRRHQARVLALAYRMLGDWDHAEDIGQEAFLRIYRSAGRYRGKSLVSTWLYRIVVNLCLDHQRRRKAVVPVEDLDTIADSAARRDPLEADETAAAVRKAVLELNERQRIAVLLHRFEDLSHAQISEITGWSVSAVESLLVRAYETLREKLRKNVESGQ